MPRPKIPELNSDEDSAFVGARIPPSWKRKIETIYGNVSWFVREAIKEKLARDEPSIKAQILEEIKRLEEEIEKKKRLLGTIEEEEKAKEETKFMELVNILKSLFEDALQLKFQTDNGTVVINGVSIKEHLEAGTRVEYLLSDVETALKQLSEVKGIPIEELKELCRKYVDGFKELEELVKTTVFGDAR